MSIWNQLSVDEAHSFYHVPLEVASSESNHFFGVKRDPFDSDGPWEFLAFLRYDNPKGILMSIHSIYPESQELESFNSLDDPGGFLSLEWQSVIDLADILIYQSKYLENPEERDDNMFIQID